MDKRLNLFLIITSFLVADSLWVFSSPVTSSVYSTYNSSCNSTMTCDPNALLTCIAGSCQCESPSNQIYLPSQNICKSTVGGQCSLNSGDVPYRPCIENAECIAVNGTLQQAQGLSANYTECRCRDKFIENVSGDCVPGIGQPCNYGSNDCNPLGMVVCKNGQCQCMDSLQIFDSEFNRCVSPAGTHCKIDSLQLGCVKNAICYPFFYWNPPKCICKPGFHQNPDRTCSIDHSSRNFVN